MDQYEIILIHFYKSNDDTISNGIALSPTLHRAFDRGLLSVDEQLKVKISGVFRESGASAYSLRQFEGQAIKVPKAKNYRPAVEKFIWHGRHVFL
jgi:putative restriction endonuclease